MSVSIIIGDALQVNGKYLCHQVNPYGVMGAGIAKQIKAKYPTNFEIYYKYCCEHSEDEVIGKILPVEEADGKTIINMFSQNGIGTTHQQTNYEAFRICLYKIAELVPMNETIVMPYLIGCGLAGGDWNIIEGYIRDILGLTHEVLLYDIDGLSRKNS